ncbi:MAG TPA: GNAT family N-acetyltransferase [Gemmatimonadaceae bacterium]|jgi:ribosomal protein S18 acetylase RimI-like enzyme|nr:GNAT family N-acetyltransferase [Gemmatimonadaceae bacterium]
MVHVGGLTASHRARVEEIVRATGAFRDEEVAVALEVFDAGVAAPAGSSADYELIGAFTDDGTLAGYACHGPTPGTDGTYDVYWLAVHPAQQARGIGTALLDAMDRALRDRGARLVVVETSGRAPYDAARRMYLRNRFVEAARLPDFYAPADDRVVYVRQVGGTSSFTGAHRAASP